MSPKHAPYLRPRAVPPYHRASMTTDARATQLVTRSKVRNGIRIKDAPGGSGAAGSGRKRAKSAAPIDPANPFKNINNEKFAGCKSRIFVGDCRDVLKALPEAQNSKIDLIFADPPFNWNRAYDQWNDALPEDQYLLFTYDWINECVKALRPGGSLWINIPDDWAAEIVCFLKGRATHPMTHTAYKPAAHMTMQNWCIWHYRFGQNTTQRFINSKVHALWFTKEPTVTSTITWNTREILELSDRAAIYGDARTLSKKDGMPAGRRVPMDVWYGQYWGRVQGNSKERRNYHDNQLPEAYLERVVNACSNPGDLVLDPFLGSGTTGVLAHALGRNFVGIEFSPDNARNAAARIAHGPVRLGANKDASTAIFKKRATRSSAKIAETVAASRTTNADK